MTKLVSVRTCPTFSNRSLGLWLITLTLTCFHTTLASQQLEVKELAPGKAFEQEISGSQTHTYQVALNPGQYLRIAIKTRGGNVKPELLDSDATKVKGACDFTGGSNLRIVSFIAEVGGTYRLNLRLGNEDTKVAAYELKVEALRTATEEDKIRLAAETAESRSVTDRSGEEWELNLAQSEEALRLWRKLDDRKAILRMLVRIGAQYVNTGNTTKALIFYREALPIAQTLNERYWEASTLLGMGNAFHRQNESQRALDMFAKARPIFASISRPDREANVISNMALVYLTLNDSDRAIRYLEQVAQTYSSLKIPRSECNALSALGVAYGDIKQPAKALESFNRALTIAREHRLIGCEGKALRHLGYVYLNLKQKEKATELFNQGLQLCRSVGNRVCEATALRGLGSVSKSAGEYEKALHYLDAALQLFRSCRERDRESIALQQLADVNLALGNLHDARKQLEEAILIKESVRADVVGQDLRDSFFVSAQDTFGLYVDVLMHLHQKNPGQGHDSAALMANERARARGLIELLSQANVDIRQGVSADLLERENSLRQQVNRAAARSRISDDRPIDKELIELTAQLREVQSQIRATSPHYAALTQPQPLSLKEIQQLLDENTVLLEFGLGRKQSWLWAVTRNGLRSYQLPSSNEIQSGSRKVYELLTARRPQPNMTESEQLKRVAEADSVLQREIAVLSKMLIGPIAEPLKSEWQGKRLVVVGSGALEYLPFAALQDPTTRAQPLIANHEIVNLPSASVLSIIRQESAGRTPAAKMLAVLADPVFENDDPRLRVALSRVGSNQHSSSLASAGEETPLQRSVRSMDRGTLSRLPFSREEANAIAALVSPSFVLKATDFRANRERATSGELGNYRIIHFATHALLNNQQPELSGLVLSLVDEKGQAQDGFLRVNELYNMRLPADLVVLSACQTALGKEIRGEGLIGLTRGFMYAGAQRVVASLWQVDDLATAELMKQFYTGMLKDKLPPGAALRSAQLSIMKEQRWSSPYYWAAFSIQGEWR